jgi:hypothetical protein
MVAVITVKLPYGLGEIEERLFMDHTNTITQKSKQVL